MRIIYLTDIHGDFEKIRALLSETIADVYLIAGDLIDIPFYNMDTSIRYHELQTFFHGLRRKSGRQHMPIEDFVDELLEDPTASEELQDTGTKYQQLTIRARRVMQLKYKVLKNIVGMKPNARIFCLPGNYDMNLRYTSLVDHDLHLQAHRLDEALTLGGYGGADVWTPGIPERYVVDYQAGVGVPETDNEMFRFFNAARPQIVVTHQPAWGIHDKTAYGGPCGSPSLRTYCDTHPVLLCLSGHAHDAWGVRYAGETLYLNPSNFGEVTLTNGGVFEGGFFHQIEIEGDTVHKIILRKIGGAKIHDVADYSRGSAWQAQVVDRERHLALRQRRNVDTTVEKYSHIPKIELFNEIKQFYRMFQTPETDDRLDSLEEVIRQLESRIRGDIAMDVMGSVNMGISQPSSDIDFALYFRCGPDCHQSFGICRRFLQTKAMIEEVLGSRYEAHIMDCINLDQVERSLEARNFECEVTQRFVAYRAMCRPVNYRVLAPVEDALDRDKLFRREVEGSIQTYIKLFAACSQNAMSFKKYESRLGEIGIRLPDSVRRKIKQYLHED